MPVVNLLSDTDHVLASAVGARSSSLQLFASRISYLVGPDEVFLIPNAANTAEVMS